MEGRASVKKGKAAKKITTGQERAGIIFAPARMTRLLRGKRVADRCSQLAGVFMAGALEYLVEELLDQAGEFCKEAKKKQIKPRHIMQAVRQDEELSKLCYHIQIAEGGVTQDSTNTMAQLWPKLKSAQAPSATQE